MRNFIAENANRLAVPRPIVSTIFHVLVSDISAAVLALGALPSFDRATRRRLRRIVTVPRTTEADWDFVSMNYSPASRVSASPKWSSFTPMRSMMPRYRLHSLRLSSPA